MISLIERMIVLGSIIWALLIAQSFAAEHKRVRVDSDARIFGKHSVYEFTHRPGDWESLKSKLEEWKIGQPYLKLSGAEFLLKYLAVEETCETPNYEWKEGTHDLRQVAGRAAWIFDELLDTRLPAVSPDSSKKELEAVTREASNCVEAYRKAMIDLASAYQVGGNIDDLAAKYNGKIKPGVTGNKAEAYSKEMASLLAEFCPIGRKIEDLEKIIGSQGKKRDGQVYFVFDSGYGGTVYRFVIRDSVVISVRIGGL